MKALDIVWIFEAGVMVRWPWCVPIAGDHLRATVPIDPKHYLFVMSEAKHRFFFRTVIF